LAFIVNGEIRYSEQLCHAVKASLYGILKKCSHYTAEWVVNKPLTCSHESVFLVRCQRVSYPQFWVSNSHASASEQWLQHATCRKNSSNILPANLHPEASLKRRQKL